MFSKHVKIAINLGLQVVQVLCCVIIKVIGATANICVASLKMAQLFAESVEINFGIESHLFGKSNFDHINKFVEAHSCHVIPLDSISDSVTDTDDDSNLVADVDLDTVIRIVHSELKNCKAPGIDNDILKKPIGAGFYTLMPRAFTLSLKLGMYPVCLEGSSPLYAHQTRQTTFTNN